VIREAGGHPAAIVFLSRLLTLHQAATPKVASLLDQAAEFAGAVYAEPWAMLGPQQRAILWHLASSRVSASAAEIASALCLPASQVSAQLTRLSSAGLLSGSRQRGRHAVAPLLARWIARRAVRDGGTVERRGESKLREVAAIRGIRSRSGAR
jgi:DNA-binding transcriptional ArsR family regulator